MSVFNALPQNDRQVKATRNRACTEKYSYYNTHLFFVINHFISVHRLGFFRVFFAKRGWCALVTEESVRFPPPKAPKPPTFGPLLPAAPARLKWERSPLSLPARAV